MAGPSPTHEELLKRLDDQHKAYLETFKLVHDALSNSLQHNSRISTPQSPPSVRGFLRRRRSTRERDGDKPNLRPSTLHSSIMTGDSEDSDDDDDLYVQTPLAPFQFTEEDLRQHLRTFKFTESGRKILETVVTRTGRLRNPNLFPQYDTTDRSHNSHYSVFDVGKDGAPLSRRDAVLPGTTEIDSAIWQAIKDLNCDPESFQPAVGRITIVREPSPVIFGAIHLTMNKYFDMDELFQSLVSDESTSANYASRPFSDDNRHQRSFVFVFEYYTLVGEECQPMPWQLADRDNGSSKDNIPISRCSSVVALSLAGEPIRRLRNPARHARTTNGFVYDPWAAWHVLNIQCYPDHRHSMDVHDSTKHYVNGPEAFLHTLLSEFKDAEKRFDAILQKIGNLVTPPPDIMFDADIRDKLLFEDEEFTYSRRYFWAYQTLSIIKSGIKAIIDGFEDTFTDDVWEGRHKTLWPMLDYDSHRNKYWRRRMEKLRRDFDKQVQNLNKLYREIDQKMKEIRTLRDQLFSGTSVLESRKSVEMAAVTILQGHNVKLLTMVSIFFLPLTFVTSVYGMTNMSTEHDFGSFGITMATVCIPFFFLIGFLNTTAGMQYWRARWFKLTEWFERKCAPSPKIENASKSEATSFSHFRGSSPRIPSQRSNQTSKSRSTAASSSEDIFPPPQQSYSFATKEAIAIRRELASNPGPRKPVPAARRSLPSSRPVATPQRVASPLSSARTMPFAPRPHGRERIVTMPTTSIRPFERERSLTIPITSMSSFETVAKKPTLTRSPSWWEGVVQKNKRRLRVDTAGGGV